jgi:hypothetical protein
MTANPYTREDDQITSPVSHPVDSDWVTVTRRSYGVARVRTRRTGEALMVHAYGGGDPRPGDWGEVAADGAFALRIGTGYAFNATFDGPATSSHLQTNQVHGVLAMHGFHRFTDGSGRRDYYTRQFYVPAKQGQAGDGPDAEADDDGFPAALLTGVNDPSGLIGTWSVLDSANMNISVLDCAVDNDVLTVRAYGADGTDWGMADTHVYADAAKPDGPPAFLATYDLDDRRVRVQARDYLGILVVAQYTAFTDGGKAPDFFTRDCFRR